MRILLTLLILSFLALPVQASFEGFKQAVQADVSIPDHFKLCFLEGLDARKDNPNIYRSYWAYVKANPPSYLDNKMIQLIEGYAVEADVPLVKEEK